MIPSAPIITEKRFRRLTHVPDPLQFLVDNLPWIVLSAFGIVYGSVHETVPGQILRILSGLLIPWLCYRYCFMRRCRFILTSELLVYDRGLLVRSADYVELYRVVDYRETHSLLQQIFGLKTVVLYSQDRTTPELRIPGISRYADVIPLIRERVEYNKRKKSVYEITNR